MNPRRSSFYELNPYEHEVRRLKDELYEARRNLLDLMPEEVQTILRGYYRANNRDETYQWQRDAEAAVIAMAKPVSRETHWYSEVRAYCPLCGQGSASAYTEGYKLPDGLGRHLTGYGKTYECPIFKTALRLARDHWDEKFRESEAAEEAAKQERLRQRKKGETLFVTEPLGEPQLIDESWFMNGTRSAEELQWAEQRLTELGFDTKVEVRTTTYLKDVGNHVVYADPRGKSEITFRVYKKPLPKQRRSVLRSRTGYFDLRDSFTKDIRKKFQDRLEQATRERG